MLTGAALTQRPDLFGAILSEVPVLDMLRSYLFEGADSEYGSPVNSEEEFRALRAYSPYANVKRQAYPAALFLTGDSDDRANPLHARKMTAAIQDATTSQAPVLLRIEHNAGHFGSVLTRQNIAKWADIYTFLNTVLE